MAQNRIRRTFPRLPNSYIFSKAPKKYGGDISFDEQFLFFCFSFSIIIFIFFLMKNRSGTPPPRSCLLTAVSRKPHTVIRLIRAFYFVTFSFLRRPRRLLRARLRTPTCFFNFFLSSVSTTPVILFRPVNHFVVDLPSRDNGAEIIILFVNVRNDNNNPW